ncbi:MAG: VOC family protein [Candidatus Andeanibacterium colombiense]|uniref:VOC family protein n=1 Tax=Candidatus Andeanibacterium colombiense TaxID=3121345 RepID=A0AAJ5X8W7_9SPHN|nr:MAG: VOC family protein [Sphingomonadaceae bacterium]
MLRFLAIILLMASASASADEPAKGRITGIGGIFFKAKDPKALAAWYREVLGLPLESWGGALLKYDAPGHPPMLVWNAFPADTDYFAPSAGDHMINYAVDDLDAFLARIEAKGVTVLKRDDSDPSGKFAWIQDPEGNKLELWQPL